MFRSLRLKFTRTSRAFTLVELLVTISAIVTLIGLIQTGRIERVDVQEEIKNVQSGAVSYRLRSTVSLPCAQDDAWLSRIDPNDPGYISVGDKRYPVDLVNDLTTDASNSASANPTLGEPQTVVEQEGEYLHIRTQLVVSYRFDEVSRSCFADVEAIVERDFMFFLNQDNLWQAKEDASLTLNIETSRTFNESWLDAYPQETRELILTLLNINQGTVQIPPVRYQLNAAYAGVLVGSGLSGDTRLNQSSANASNGRGSAMIAGCSLQPNSPMRNELLLLSWLFFAMSGLVLLRFRRPHHSSKGSIGSR